MRLFDKIWLAAIGVALISVMAWAQTGTLTYSIIPNGGITPIFGPVYTGAIPAPAQAAGFTQLVMNADFSNTTFFPNIAAFVTPCGGPSTNPTWHLAHWGAFPNGPADVTAGECAALIDIENDPTIGKNVLHEHYDHTRAAAGADANGAILVLTFPAIPFTSDHGLYFPVMEYTEITFRQSAGGLTQPAIPASCNPPTITVCSVLLQDFWFNGANDQQFESDSTETSVNSATTTSWGMGSDGPIFSADILQYHTIATLFTSAAGASPTDIEQCTFLDGVAVGNGAAGCSIPARRCPSNQSPCPEYSTHSRYFMSWFGLDTQYFAAPPGQTIIVPPGGAAVTNDEDTYIQSIRVWTCPGGWGTTNPCFGTLVDHWPFP